MRSIGEFDREDQATLFIGYLKGIAIRAEVEEDEEGGPWTIWVYEEHQLDQAKAELKQFRLNAEDSKYQHLAQQAETQEREAAKKAKKQRWREERLARRWRSSSGLAGRCTLCLIGISVVVFLIEILLPEDLHGNNQLDYLLTFYLPSVFKGEVWRLVTPIFIHYSPLHILFNMLWLFDLGGMVEHRRGSWFLILFVVIVAVSSNLCQYLLAGPGFGGMSGVVFGLFGYIWMKGKFDPGDGLVLHPNTIMLMLVFFGLGFTGLLPIALGCHIAGLAGGTLWGYLSATLKPGR
ncbi:MAG: hypothetical protein CMM58_13845 [Rhodospirillaceae bacterium]|nr:hypothetical protein [Rhodospirillaceae bacterium]